MNRAKFVIVLGLFAALMILSACDALGVPMLAPPTPFPTSTPFALGAPTSIASKCVPHTPQALKPSNLVAELIMAEGAGANGEPVNRTGEFLARETIHAIVGIKNAPANTKIRAVFYALDAGNATQCNVKLGESEQSASGSRYLDFALAPANDKPWLLGKYRVEIFVNGALDHVANFVVVTQKQVH
ncbi:MAG: hypothetical protein HZC40_11705 [Chloroflexi bacterium]|nr:hypothetical protein [Chloroflexota bacterium]